MHNSLRVKIGRILHMFTLNHKAEPARTRMDRNQSMGKANEGRRKPASMKGKGVAPKIQNHSKADPPAPHATSGRTYSFVGLPPRIWSGLSVTRV